jgi:hypothetical protein
MGNLRRLLASAVVSGDLSHNPNRETAPDRIGALACSQIGEEGENYTLGATLLRLRYAHDAACYAPAVQLLADLVERPNEVRSTIVTLCGVVLNEWLYDLCPTCNGRGHSVIEGTGRAGRPCSACNGTGMARHSDQQRMVEMGFTPSTYVRWVRRFAYAHSVLAAAEANTGRATAQQLDRVRH